MNDLKLKLKLAKELPELIRVDYEEHPVIRANEADYVTEYHFAWLDTNKEVTDREWDWVVNQLILGLDDLILVQYCLELGAFVMNTTATKVHRATWQQRAISYFKVTNK